MMALPLKAMAPVNASTTPEEPAEARTSGVAEEAGMQSSKREPHGERHQGDGGSGGALGAERPAERQRALGEVAHEAHDVVSDRGDGKAFDGRLQFQLQVLPPVHGGQQRLAAL